MLFAPFFLLFQRLAEESIFFTTVNEGTVKAVMRGDSFERFLMSFEGHHLNDPKRRWYDNSKRDWEILSHKKDQDDEFDDRPNWLRKLGLYWIGFPWANSIYVYEFEWNETKVDKTTGAEQIYPRAEATDFAYVADFTYAIKTVGAETSDRLPTDELTLVTVAIRNPYRALFSGEDWMRRITAAINRHVRNFVGQKTFKELLQADKGTNFSNPIINLNSKLPDDPLQMENGGLKGRYGIEIRTADLQTIELSGDLKQKSEEATTREYVAQQEANATTIAGKAKAEVITTVGEAEAKALKSRLATIKEFGDDGILLAQLDAMRDANGAGARVIWANNPFIPKGLGK